MSEYGTCRIERIEFGETETRVYYTKDGVVALDLFIQFLDENGREVFGKFDSVHKDYIADRRKGTHVSIFPRLDGTKKYKLRYFPQNITLMEQEKIMIPLADGASIPD